MTATPHGLARRSIGAGGLWFFGVSASAPMTVLAGGVVTTYASTGVVGVPLSFLVLAAALMCFTVGFAALCCDVPHAAAFPAILALGLGRPAGVAGAAVAVLAYNAIQISLYGLLGATATALVGGVWWAWALAAWLVVAVLGIADIGLSARVVAALVIAELAVIAAFDLVGFTHPADTDPITFLRPLTPDALVVDGIGGVMALSVAAFIGFESVGAFREETRHRNAVRHAMLAALAFLGLFYAVSSWALAVAVGPGDVVDAARAAGGDLPFAVLATHLGPAVAAVGLGLLALSIVGAMVAFHNVVARYVFALGREGVIPFGLGTTIGGTTGVPVGGSLLQSLLALTVIGLCGLGGADSLTMFTVLSALAAVGVMALMVAASVAVIAAYRPARPGRPGLWTRLVAPAAGALAMTAVLAVTVANLGPALGDTGGAVAWTLPATTGAAATLGTGWALWLRRHRPATWNAIGRGQPRPLAIHDRGLNALDL